MKVSLHERLLHARKQVGLTLECVSKKTGIGISSLSDYENGKREPRISQLKKLSDTYHKPFSFFLDEGPVAPEAVLWRKKPDEGAGEIESRFLKLCHQYNHLETLHNDQILGDLPVESGSSAGYGYSKAESLAKKVRDLMQLGDHPGCVLNRVLEEQYGVKVFHKDFLPSGSALSSKSDTFGYAIILNPTNKRWRRNFDLAHELFHLLTWEIFEHSAAETSTTASDWEDNLAQCFAANLLMPADALKKAIDQHKRGNNLSPDSLFDLARLFDVSIQALIWRIHIVYNWGTESSDKTNILISTVEKYGLQIEEKREDSKPPEWPDRYFALAYQALNEGKISTGKFAEYVEISRYEAMKYINQEEGQHDEEISLSPV